MTDPPSTPEPGRRPLVLVDASSYLYRAYHALPPLTNSRGRPTGAVYGVINMLRKLLNDYRPQRIGVVFDARGPTFRDDLFEAYKAHRPPMPDDLAAQVAPLHEMVRAMGLPLLQVEGVEADDVIGTLSRIAAERGMDTLISTGDKDMAQLVNGHVTLVNTMSGTLLDRAGVIDKFGVPPELMVDYLALVGDTSDNIPGVPKVGPKTAAKWLSRYGSLDGVLEHADEIRGKVGECLRENLEQLSLSRELARIRLDVELGLGPDDLVPGNSDTDTLRRLYRELEFNSWLRQLDESGAGKPALPPGGTDERRYECVLARERLDAWLARLREAPLFAFDTETDTLDYRRAHLVGLSFAVEPGEAAYVPVAHAYPGAPEQLGREEVLEAMRGLLEDPERAKLGQNLKYDWHVLANHGLHLDGIAHDTMLESYVLNSASGRHDMDSLAVRELGLSPVKFEDVAGKGAKQITFDQVALEEASDYAAEDADITLRLHRSLWPRLSAEASVRRVYQEIEIPLVPVLATMEHNGVLIDTALLERQSRELAERMAAIEERAHQAAGGPFNLGSPKQLQEILFERLGLPVQRKTPKGQPSTAEDVLQELALEFELPRLILDYRSVSKLKSTYTDKLPAQVNPETGRVHTSYHQAVAATGRLSSSDPNLQNIPIRTEVGRRIRQAFIAPPDCRLVAADYSQIELRIMAHLSQDEGLLRAFAEGEDIHRATAAEVFGGDPDSVSADQRRSAKAINFGLIYGMSAFGLARQLGIDRESAQAYVDRYFARYPKVQAFMDRTRRLAREQGFVETVYGRRLYIPDINAGNGQRRQYAERTAINAPMQGTAADIIKRAMIAIHDWLPRAGYDCRMIMQVHDELVFEVADAHVAAFVEDVKRRMAGAADLGVPLEVEAGVGGNWDEAH
ncbi:MAG TPA: DNA polymerase I [Gammaproteobacteria bacterium]|nr:DNA polymerase I [Gammaproteobacteria bacterium]